MRRAAGCSLYGLPSVISYVPLMDGELAGTTFRPLRLHRIYCAMGISEGEAAHKDTIDPEAWAIVDGKLYLTHNRYWMQIWRESATERIRQADQAWEVVEDLPAPEIVGPPCAASPPTTKVALRDG